MGLLEIMSAVGTTLGPSLSGILIAGIGWCAIFLVNLPIGLSLYLTHRYLRPAGRGRTTCRRRSMCAAHYRWD